MNTQWVVIHQENEFDVLCYGVFNSFTEAQTWTVNQTQEEYKGAFTILPIRNFEK